MRYYMLMKEIHSDHACIGFRIRGLSHGQLAYIYHQQHEMLHFELQWCPLNQHHELDIILSYRTNWHRIYAKWLVEACHIRHQQIVSCHYGIRFVVHHDLKDPNHTHFHIRCMSKYMNDIIRRLQTKDYFLRYRIGSQTGIECFCLFGNGSKSSANPAKPKPNLNHHVNQTHQTSTTNYQLS